MTIYLCRNGEDIGSWPEPEFRERIFRSEILPNDYYFHEGMSDWALVSTYRVPQRKQTAPPPLPSLSVTPSLPVAASGAPSQSKNRRRRKETPASIGGACALIALFAPLVYQGLFFLISLPLILAAFVLAIVSIAKGRVLGGIVLLMSLVIVGPGSCDFMVDRDRWIHHPEQIANEARENRAKLTQAQEIRDAMRERRVISGMSNSEVRQTWGRPASVVNYGDLQEWNYGITGKVYLRDGYVVEVSQPDR